MGIPKNYVYSAKYMGFSGDAVNERQPRRLSLNTLSWRCILIACVKTLRT